MRPELQGRPSRTKQSGLLSLPATFCDVAWEQSQRACPSGTNSCHKEAAPPPTWRPGSRSSSAWLRAGPLHFLGNGKSEENKIPQETDERETQEAETGPWAKRQGHCRPRRRGESLTLRMQTGPSVAQLSPLPVLNARSVMDSNPITSLKPTRTQSPYKSEICPLDKWRPT